MLRDQFIVRTILTVVLGVLFVCGAIWQAGNCPAEEKGTRGVLRTSMAIICTGISLVYWIYVIGSLQFIEFPTQMLPEPYTPYTIIREYGVNPVWGAPTYEQFLFFSCLSGAILSLAIAFYLFFYRKSNSKIWAKVLKVFNFVLVYGMMANLNFIYFDIWEFLRLFIYAIFLVFNLLVVRKFGYYDD